MSGIAVIYNFDGRPADGLLLDRMLSAIAHRGRDGMGRWIGGPVAIGHAMLHTTPESTRERQPLCEDGLYLTFDGRVDNREELAAAFKDAGIELKGDGDAELVLRAYQLWGDESPRRILGDFAYALWDGRIRRLLCARDPMGVKPLFYHIGPGFFLCGSELNQLLQDPRVRRAPNEAMVAEYLLGAFSNREDTLYSGLMRLAGGDLLVVRPDGVTKRTWLALDPGKKISYRTDDEYAEHLRGLVEEAVRCRMRSVGGVASELSGGIDSSAVVGVVQKLRREDRVPATPFETFSLSFSEAAADESAYVNDVARMWQIEPHCVPSMIPTMQSLMERVRRYRETPVPPNCEMFDSLRALVATRGFRVCLTGLGGDDWHCGSPYQYASLVRGLRLGDLARRLRSDMRLNRADRVVYFNGYYGLLRNLLKATLWPLLPEPAVRLFKTARGRAAFPGWLNPEFARRTSLAERLRDRRRLPQWGSLTQRQSYQQIKNPWVTYFIEAAERTSSWFGFDIRHPLHDLRVIEFTLATPDDQRRRGEYQKFAFRNAMRGLVPESVLVRLDKGDFLGIAIAALRNLNDAGVLKSPKIDAIGWVKAEELREAYQRTMSLYASGDARAAEHLWPLFAACAVELWFGSVFDGNDAIVAPELLRASPAGAT
jgi:asparagine synthase (glutamine-hydrolysing)